MSSGNLGKLIENPADGVGNADHRRLAVTARGAGGRRQAAAEAVTESGEGDGLLGRQTHLDVPWGKPAALAHQERQV